MRPHDKFSADEDAKLMVLAGESTQPDWFAVALQLPGRSARQCKDRWQKYLNPDIKRCAWTPSEDLILRDRYDELGPKWARIAAFLPNRTDYMAKNRFAQLVRHGQKAAKGARKSSKCQPTVMGASVEPETGLFDMDDPVIEFPSAYDGCGCDLEFLDDFWL
jgi:hypothetical protein